jgi:hypothetical protein
MRYLVQFLIPIVIFIGVVYILTRQRRRSRAETGDGSGDSSDAPMFIAILVISALVALGTAYALATMWG